MKGFITTIRSRIPYSMWEPDKRWSKPQQILIKARTEKSARKQFQRYVKRRRREFGEEFEILECKKGEVEITGYYSVAYGYRGLNTIQISMAFMVGSQLFRGIAVGYGGKKRAKELAKYYGIELH